MLKLINSPRNKDVLRRAIKGKAAADAAMADNFRSRKKWRQYARNFELHHTAAVFHRYELYAAKVRMGKVIFRKQLPPHERLQKLHQFIIGRHNTALRHLCR